MLPVDHSGNRWSSPSRRIRRRPPGNPWALPALLLLLVALAVPLLMRGDQPGERLKIRRELRKF